MARFPFWNEMKWDVFHPGRQHYAKTTGMNYPELKEPNIYPLIEQMAGVWSPSGAQTHPKQCKGCLTVRSRGFPDSSVDKESACNAANSSSIPGLRKSSGEGIGYPLQGSWSSFVAQLVKNPPANAGDCSSIPGLGRFPGERNGYLLQYCGLENSDISQIKEFCNTLLVWFQANYMSNLHPIRIMKTPCWKVLVCFMAVFQVPEKSKTAYHLIFT